MIKKALTLTKYSKKDKMYKQKFPQSNVYMLM